MNTRETYSIENPLGNTDICAKFVIDDVSMPFILNDITRVNDGYTISFWVKSEESGSLRIYDKIFATTAEWQKYSTVFVANNTKLNIYFENTGAYYIYHPKLEIGNKATDWTPAPEDLETRVTNAETSIESNSDAIELRATKTEVTDVVKQFNDNIDEALDDFVNDGDYAKFKQTTESQLKVLSDQISFNFTSTTNAIDSTNSDLDSRFAELSKYIKFSGETAISIGSGDSAITLEIDNETGIVFKKNGKQFGWWDGVDFHTGNIIVDVDERAQFGNFAFVPRSDGSLSFIKIGG